MHHRPACGWVDKASRQSQAEFTSVACGQADNADLNAAHTIMDAQGYRLLHGERRLRWQLRWPVKLIEWSPDRDISVYFPSEMVAE